MFNLLKADGFDVKKNWSLDTLRRYLYVGKRISEPALKRVLNIWELHEGRNSLADTITNLRAFVQAFAGQLILDRKLRQDPPTMIYRLIISTIIAEIGNDR